MNGVEPECSPASSPPNYYLTVLMRGTHISDPYERLLHGAPRSLSPIAALSLIDRLQDIARHRSKRTDPPSRCRGTLHVSDASARRK